MEIPKSAPGILFQARKWILRVLDPEHEAVVRELETQRAALIEGTTILAENNSQVIECIKGELNKQNLRIDMKGCNFIGIDGSVNSGNSHHLDSHTNNSVICLPDTTATHGIFDDYDKQVELAKKLYPKGGH